MAISLMRMLLLLRSPPSSVYRRRPPFSTAFHHSSSFPDHAFSTEFHHSSSFPNHSGGKAASQGTESTNYSIKMKLDDDAARICMVIPGIARHDLRVWYQNNALNYKGISRDDEFDVSFLCEGSVELPMGVRDQVKVDQIKVHLQDGVLKVTIPRAGSHSQQLA